jgi:hypothetical protein
VETITRISSRNGDPVYDVRPLKGSPATARDSALYKTAVATGADYGAMLWQPPNDNALTARSPVDIQARSVQLANL